MTEPYREQEIHPALRIRLQPGDILTACDNELNVPSGYMGHSAIAVSEQTIVEAVITKPYIQTAPREHFFKSHPKCAVYRPVDSRAGMSAAHFAHWYWQQSNHYERMGVHVPPFSFSQQIPLSDPWTGVYCSKLVWLSYYYSVGFELMNDFGLFTPEDLDTNLSRDARFILLYKHPDFAFFIDT